MEENEETFPPPRRQNSSLAGSSDMPPPPADDSVIQSLTNTLVQALDANLEAYGTDIMAAPAPATSMNGPSSAQQIVEVVSLPQEPLLSSDVTNLAMPNTFEQIPLSTVIHRVDAGSECLMELLQSFRYRMEMEEKNIALMTRISRQSIYEHEMSATSSEKMLGYFKNYFIFLTQEHQKYFTRMNEEVLKALDGLKGRRNAEVNKFKLLVQQAFRDHAMALEALDKAKKTYAKARADVYSTQGKLAQLEIDVVEYRRQQEEKKKEKEMHSASGSKFSMGRMLSSAFEAAAPDSERDRQKRKLAKRYKLLVECTIAIAAKKKALAKRIEERDSIIGMAALAFEAAELERLDQTQIALKVFCEIEKEMTDRRSKHLAKFMSTVNAADTKADLKLFIKREKNNELTHKHARALALLDWDYHRKMQSFKTEQNGIANTSAFSVFNHTHITNMNMQTLQDLNKHDWGELRSLSTDDIFPSTIDATFRQSQLMFLLQTHHHANAAANANANIVLDDDDDLAPAPIGNTPTHPPSSSHHHTHMQSAPPPPAAAATVVTQQQAPAPSGSGTPAKRKSASDYFSALKLKSKDKDKEKDKEKDKDREAVLTQTQANTLANSQLAADPPALPVPIVATAAVVSGAANIPTGVVISISNSNSSSNTATTGAGGGGEGGGEGGGGGDAEEDYFVLTPDSPDGPNNHSPRSEGIAAVGSLDEGLTAAEAAALAVAGAAAAWAINDVGPSLEDQTHRLDSLVHQLFGEHLHTDTCHAEPHKESTSSSTVAGVDIVGAMSTVIAEVTNAVGTLIASVSPVTVPADTTGNESPSAGTLQQTRASEGSTVGPSVAIASNTAAAAPDAATEADAGREAVVFADAMAAAVGLTIGAEKDGTVLEDITNIMVWADVFSSKASRDMFLQDLDIKRGTHAQLPPPALSALGTALTSLLNQCQIERDIKSAMRVANMANTFHRTATDGAGDTHDHGQGHGKVYLQQDSNLGSHPIWREEGFWDSALFIGIAAELEHRDPVLWDDLTPEMLREQVLAIQNIVFGQLGTMAVTMHEIGLSHVEVAKRLTKMSRVAQLNEDQILDLLKTVKHTFKLTDSTAVSPSSSSALSPSTANATAAAAAASAGAPLTRRQSDPSNNASVGAPGDQIQPQKQQQLQQQAQQQQQQQQQRTKTVVASPTQRTEDQQDEYAVL